MAKVQDRIRGLRGRFSGVRRPSARRFCQWVRGRTTRSPETTAGRYAPRLTKVRYALPCVLLTAGALAWALYTGLWDLAPRTELRNEDGTRYWGINRLELVKTTITACGFVGAVLAGLYAYRKQKIAENEAHRADADQFAQRYTTAAEQLGHDQAAVRLAGVYAMARLADDWTEQRQTCIDVLCAYLRMPYALDPGSPRYRHGEKQVRHTIITVIRTHLTDPQHPHTWCGHDLDFTGATFDGGDFSGAVFPGAEICFRDANFSEGNHFFTDTKILGGTMSFHGAQFSGGTTLSFENIHISNGSIEFTDAKLLDGTIGFACAKFLDGRIDFMGMNFQSGITSFGFAHFHGSEINFHGAVLSGGCIDFLAAKLSRGGIYFVEVEFSGGTASFQEMEHIGGSITFSGSTISGTEFTPGPFQELVDRAQTPPESNPST